MAPRGVHLAPLAPGIPRSGTPGPPTLMPPRRNAVSPRRAPAPTAPAPRSVPSRAGCSPGVCTSPRLLTGSGTPGAGMSPSSAHLAPPPLMPPRRNAVSRAEPRRRPPPAPRCSPEVCHRGRDAPPGCTSPPLAPGIPRDPAHPARACPPRRHTWPPSRRGSTEERRLSVPSSGADRPQRIEVCHRGRDGPPGCAPRPACSGHPTESGTPGAGMSPSSAHLGPPTLMPPQERRLSVPSSGADPLQRPDVCH
jgi:hypothetical protein